MHERGREAIAPNFGPPVARYPPDEAVRHRGIDMLAFGELAERQPPRLRFEDPVERPCPTTDHFK
jgi:hypothetical protein